MPVADGVATYAALTRAADTARSQGDPRSRGQVMADALRDGVLAAATRPCVDPVNGPTPADDSDERAEGLAGAPAGVGVVLDIIITDRQLFGIGSGSDGDALIGAMTGALHPTDADLARQYAALTPTDRLWVRRLYADPTTGELVALDSRRRRFPPGLQRLIRLRDQHCLTPWCRAPIRHTDHTRPWADDGPTDADNGGGRCEACNYAKDALGWSTTVLNGTDGHRLRTTTPTGHRYTTTPPRILWTYRDQPTIHIVTDRPPRAA